MVLKNLAKIENFHFLSQFYRVGVAAYQRLLDFDFVLYFELLGIPLREHDQFLLINNFDGLKMDEMDKKSTLRPQDCSKTTPTGSDPHKTTQKKSSKSQKSANLSQKFEKISLHAPPK